MSKKSLKSHIATNKPHKMQWKGKSKTRTTYENWLKMPAHEQAKYDKKDLVYEGTQYKGGRKEGRKNLKTLDNGNLLNQHKLEFTKAEKKKLESLVNRANAKRNKMLREEGDLDRIVGGKPTGQKVSSLQQMGVESDFIISHKSKSLQRFKTREQFDDYIKHLEQVNSPSYIDDKTRAYKRNHIKALREAYGDDAEDVVMKIRMMKPAEYRKLIQQDEEMQITFFYAPEEKTGKLNRIRASMGMKLKEEPIGIEG